MEDGPNADVTITAALGQTVMDLAALESLLTGFIGHLQCPDDIAAQNRFVTSTWGATTKTIRDELTHAAVAHPQLEVADIAADFAGLATTRNLYVHGVWLIADDGRSARVEKPARVRSDADTGWVIEDVSVGDVIAFSEKVYRLYARTLALWDRVGEPEH